MTAIIDYDAGNLKSVAKALAFLGEDSVITRDPEEILAADRVVLPGVGNFGDAMEQLRGLGLDEVIRETARRGIPFLGICLGLQLLFESSEESPGAEGLGILKGRIVRIPNGSDSGVPAVEDGESVQDGESLKIPHIGWNSLTLENEGRLFAGLSGEPYVYFVHSYYLQADDPQIVKASTEYGAHIHASVEQGNVFACQFHPEKSGSVGLHILKNFIALQRA